MSCSTSMEMDSNVDDDDVDDDDDDVPVVDDVWPFISFALFAALNY